MECTKSLVKGYFMKTRLHKCVLPQNFLYVNRERLAHVGILIIIYVITSFIVSCTNCLLNNCFIISYETFNLNCITVILLV